MLRLVIIIIIDDNNFATLFLLDFYFLDPIPASTPLCEDQYIDSRKFLFNFLIYERSQVGNVFLCVLFLILFCLWKKEELAWKVRYDHLLSGWGEMAKLGCFTGLRITSTYGLLISSHILAQSSGPSTAETVVVLDKVALLYFSTMFGGGYATAILAGEALGNRSKCKFKYAVKVGLANCAIERCFAILIFQFTIVPFARTITHDEAVLNEVREARPSLEAMLVVAALDELLARGILCPMAKHTFVGVTTMVCIYFLGIPLLTYLILIRKVRAGYIFLCSVMSLSFQCLAYIVKISYIDLDTEIKGCNDRNMAVLEGYEENLVNQTLVKKNTCNEDTDDNTTSTSNYNAIDREKKDTAELTDGK